MEEMLNGVITTIAVLVLFVLLLGLITSVARDIARCCEEEDHEEE